MKKLLLLLLVLAVPVVRAQTPINVQKTSGTNAITANLNIGTGKTLTVDSGGTFVLNGSFSPGAGTIAWSALTGQPTTIAGYGITDGVSTGSSYADPSWITSLGAGKLTGTVSAARLPAFSGDLTTPGGSTVTTLSTVNANTGTWGDATHSPTFTVNNKGLITGASQSALQVASTGISDSTVTGRALITASNPASARSTLVLATVANTGSYTDLSNQPTFNTLSPMTTLGDTIYGAASGAGTRLPGNTTAARQFLRQTGTGSVSAAPAWDALVNADIPTALTGKTYNGLTATALATGFSIAGGTTSKVLTVPLDATISGTNTGDQTITLTGDVTGTGTASFATTLATVNSNVGSFGSGTLVPTFTVDGKGRLTAAGSATSTPVFANITSKPTTAAGYGITNGATIDSWGTKAVPTGVVADLTSAQAFSNKTYEGHTWTTGAGTLTMGGNFTTSGAFNTTLTTTANTSLTLPTTGTLATLAGTENFMNKAITASSIDSTPIGTGVASTGGFTTVSIYSSGQMRFYDSGNLDYSHIENIGSNLATQGMEFIASGSNGFRFQTFDGSTARDALKMFDSGRALFGIGLDSPTIGATTPGSGTFTTFGTTGDITITKSVPKLILVGTEGSAATGSLFEQAGVIHLAHNGVSDVVTFDLGSLQTQFAGNVNSVTTVSGLAVAADHFKGTGTAPTIAAGTGAGTSPTISVTGHDSAFTITLTTGSIPTAAGTVCTVTFHAAYSNAPHFSLTPSSAAAALLSGVTMVIPSSTTTTFVLTAGATAPTAATSYTWEVLVIQ